MEKLRTFKSTRRYRAVCPTPSLPRGKNPVGPGVSSTFRPGHSFLTLESSTAELRWMTGARDVFTVVLSTVNQPLSMDRLWCTRQRGGQYVEYATVTGPIFKGRSLAGRTL